MAEPEQQVAAEPTSEESRRDTTESKGSRSGSHHGHRRRVLIPVDPSENSLRAAEWFCKYGMRAHDHIYLFHSVDTSAIIPSMGYTLAGPLPLAHVENLLKEKEHEVTELKKKFEHLLHEHGAKGEFVYTSVFPHAGEAICHAVTDRKIDYVVMGSRGMGAIRRTFLGSISDYVLHHAHVPMSIIPPALPHTPKKDH